MSLNKRALGLILLTLTIALAMTGSAIYSGVFWETADNTPMDDNWDTDDMFIYNSSGDGWDRVAPHNESEFKVLTFGPDFVLPDLVTVPIPVLEMTNPLDNTTDGEALLSSHGLFWSNETTTVQTGERGIAVLNELNSTYVDYQKGTIEFRAENPDYKLATVSEIEANGSLLNRSEALEVVVHFLKEHALYNASWELTAQGAHACSGMMHTEDCIRVYHFRFTPILMGRSLSEPNAPRITVYIDPMGQVTQLDLVLRDISMTGETALPRFPEPLDALLEIEHNYFGYFLCTNPKIHIVSMAPGYMVDEDAPTRLVPCWAIHYNSGNSILEL